MQHPTDEIVARLEAEHPNWQVWVVHRAYGGPVWCARRWDEEKRVLNADSPAGLAEQLEDEASR